MELPKLPDPVPVELEGGSFGLLVLDITDALCGTNPACRETLPAILRLLEKARGAKAKVVFSMGRAPQKLLPDLARREEEPVVRGPANKYFGTDLERLLEGIETLVLTGTSANGAVLYTAFESCIRGKRVVVPEDAISARDPLAVWMAKYQLLNQPGYGNPQNVPLAAQAVTLSRSDWITFRP
jgi:nicotinamidase-related amidase